MASFEAVAPTVMAFGVEAGEYEQALAELLPAAMPKVTPAAMALVTASLTAWLKPPPKLMLAAAGATWLAATQSMPAMTPDQVPEPPQSSTRTEWSVAFWAKP